MNIESPSGIGISSAPFFFRFLFMFLSRVAAADTFYLHANMPYGSDPNDGTIWYNDPVSGVTQSSLVSPTAGSRFAINGYEFRTQVSSGTASFDGTLAVDDAGAVIFMMFAQEWIVAGMDIDNTLTLRPHRTNVTYTVSNLNVGADGNLQFRTLTGNNLINLSVAELSGSGRVQFGRSDYANDVNGVWNVSVTDTDPEFSGIVELVRGQLVFAGNFALADATLTIDASENNSVVLANNTTFHDVQFGSAYLTNGTYTAAGLNAFFNTSRFLGNGTLTVTEPVHPRLFFSSSDISSIQQKVQSGWLQNAFAVMHTNADVYMDVSVDPYPISGASNGSATAGRAINERVNTLALTGMILNDSSYINKAIAICMAAIAQTDVDDFDAYNGHLAIGDALHAYAVAYDWLYNDMTVEQRTALYNEIMEFRDWIYEYSTSGEYYGRYEPTPLSCNHNSVIHGALGLAALATSGNNSDFLTRAALFIDGYFQYARDTTGYNYEGIGYYGYGSLGAVPFAVAYDRAGYLDLIDEEPKNYLIPEWLLRFTQPWGSSVVALNDSPERMGISSGMMQMISQNQDNVGLWAWQKMYGADGDGTYSGPVNGYIGDGCTIPYVILFADASLQSMSPVDAELPLGMFFARGSGSFRSSWEDDAALATFTCGFDQHRGHNHRDENSFTFSAFNEYFVIDPGYVPWETRSHNSILVNGVGQDREETEYDTYGEIIASTNFSSAWYMKGDATDAYRDFLDLDHAYREFLFVKAPQPYIIISDDITSGSTNEFSWLLHTKKENMIAMGAGEFVIQGPETNSAVCYVKFLSSTQGLTVAESDLTGQTFIARGVTYNYSKYFKEVAANWTGVNPKFTAILVAAESLEDIPDIETTQTANGMTVNVEFPNGVADQIDIGDGDMDFNRIGDLFYLHEDMPPNELPTTTSLWFDDSAAGNNLDMFGGTISGNRFDVNGFAFRAPNTALPAVFSGTFVVGDAGSDYCMLYASDWSVEGFDVNNSLVMRPHRPVIDLSVSHLTVGTAGSMEFRTLTGNNIVNVSIDDISGSGYLGFGIDSYDNDTNGVWGLTITDATPEFVGTVDLTRGELTFDSSFSLPDAAFSIDSAEDNHVVLAHNVSFDQVTFGAGSLAQGTYTAAALNAAFGTDRFSGSGTLTVE